MSTGNEFIAIPDVSRASAGVRTISFMYTAFRACIEVRGSADLPLIRPVVEVGGDDLFSEGVEAELTSYWIPNLRASRAGLEASTVIFAPLERRGFACVLTVTNSSQQETRVKAGWRGCWESTYHTARLAKMMAGMKHASISSWQPGVPVIEYRGHTPLFAIALLSEEITNCRMWGGEGPEQLTGWTGGSITARAGAPVYHELANEYVLAPGESRVIPVYVGVGLEEVSAVASAHELKLQGWDRMLLSLRSWLDTRTIKCDDAYFERLINTNSFYNYFFSQAIALDTEELVLTTARSSRNEYCAAYRDRHAMLWSLPAILQIDWAQARKVLIHAFTVQMPNVGVHSRYINGIVLEPGLQLDQVCAPLRALHSYVSTTNDLSVLYDRRVQTGVNTMRQTLTAQGHPEVALFETLLLPSGEPSRYPYVCYSNILVWRALRDIAWLYDRIRDTDRAIEADVLAERVKAAIQTHFVVDGPFGPMYAQSVDLHGNYEVGDDPTGSIQLAAYHGFCSQDDPVYRSTVRWIHSEHNPRSGCGLPFASPFACREAGPSVVGAVNDLLTGRVEQALDFLRRAPLDCGIACEAVEASSGRAIGGGDFASCAGYLAFGLRMALNLPLPEVAAAPAQHRLSEALYQPPPPEASQVSRKARL